MNAVADRIHSLNDTHGTLIVYNRLAAGTFNSATGKVSGSSTTTHNVKASIRDYKLHEIKGLLQQGDKRVILAADALSFAPSEKDSVLLDSRRYSVLFVEPVYNKSSIVAYRLTVRGSNG